VGHSIGASVAIKWLTERAPEQSLAGVFLIATSFWGDLPPWQWKDVQLSPDVKLPRALPLFLYHGSDDETVPSGHLASYETVFPQAHVQRLQERNHQLNDNLAEVASDIR